MQAGIAHYGRNYLRRIGAFLTLMGLIVVMLPLVAFGDEWTGTVPDNCVKFDVEDGDPQGPESPVLFPDVDITLDSWNPDDTDPEGATFTVAGLEAGQHVMAYVKAGNDGEFTEGPYGNGQHTLTIDYQNAISHITFCVEVEESETFDLEVEKVWAGEEVDLEGITVTFDFDPSDTGLEDGDVVTITEDVEGELPEGCTYTSDLDEVSPYTVDATDAVDGVISLTVTNTVDCEKTTTSTSTTTTTVQDTTTTTIEDEVLGTTVTTQGPTTTTIEDEVLGAEVLPFTGADSGMLGLIAGSLGLLGTLVVMAARRIED
jgi:hypothetical protein